MAKRIVYGFETVKIQKAYGQNLRIAATVSDCRFHTVVEQRPIGQAREGVVISALAEIPAMFYHATDVMCEAKNEGDRRSVGLFPEGIGVDMQPELALIPDYSTQHIRLRHLAAQELRQRKGRVGHAGTVFIGQPGHKFCVVKRLYGLRYGKLLQRGLVGVEKTTIRAPDRNTLRQPLAQPHKIGQKLLFMVPIPLAKQFIYFHSHDVRPSRFMFLLRGEVAILYRTHKFEYS
ncbi:hypothetical protein ACQZV8_05255 [Magnetococcales bacterium HHB-1]